MEVNLINNTEDALELLLYTKNTRLAGAQSLQDIVNWDHDKKLEHLEYMRNTIKSSWEFVDYTFEIKDVTRAFTHQLVRTRNGSYAQQSQRTVDARNNGFMPAASDVLNKHMEHSFELYAAAVENGVQIQDARNILPTATYTSIIAKFSLRTLHEMALVRLCTRTQGEYQSVFKEMRNKVIEVHPWAKDFIKVQCAWNGTCAFPNYEECPIQKYTLKANVTTMALIDRAIESTNHIANPIAKDGKTM